MKLISNNRDYRFRMHFAGAWDMRSSGTIFFRSMSSDSWSWHYNYQIREFGNIRRVNQMALTVGYGSCRQFWQCCVGFMLQTEIWLNKIWYLSEPCSSHTTTSCSMSLHVRDYDFSYCTQSSRDLEINTMHPREQSIEANLKCVPLHIRDDHHYIQPQQLSPIPTLQYPCSFWTDHPVFAYVAVPSLHPVIPLVKTILHAYPLNRILRKSKSLWNLETDLLLFVHPKISIYSSRTVLTYGHETNQQMSTLLLNMSLQVCNAGLADRKQMNRRAVLF